MNNSDILNLVETMFFKVRSPNNKNNEKLMDLLDSEYGEIVLETIETIEEIFYNILKS